MKKLKFILCVGILGVMTYGGITAYNHLTMTEQERLLLANVEALTSGETGVRVRCVSKFISDTNGNGITTCSPCKFVKKAYAAFDADYGYCYE